MRPQIYQEILDRIDSVIPCEWSDLVFWAEDDGASYSYVFYISSGGKYVQCYEIPSIDKKEIARVFKEVRKLIAASREKDDSWTSMTMKVNSKGKFKADFGYDDLNENAYERRKEWKKTYLR